MHWPLKNIITCLRHIIAPPCCYHCHVPLAERTPLCSTCTKQLEPIVSCTISLTATTHMTIHAAAAYDGPLRTLILQKHSSTICASYALADYIREQTPFMSTPCDILIPIPLHWTRHYSRGFNQAHIIANHLAQHRPCPVIAMIQRHKRTILQSTLSSKQRAENVVHAFSLHNASQHIANHAGKNLVIIDDLMTSGSTLRYAAHCLLKLKPASITAFVACRARLQ